MLKSACVNCSEYKRCKEGYASWIFFIIGMIATIAVRVVTVLAHLNPIYGQIAWYIGVAGFFIFFVYKYRVDRARYKLIVKANLMDKIQHQDLISRQDRELISSILCALSSNKDRINYFIIFASSALALVIAFYFDLIVK
jgi:hypothetical protein